VARAVLPPQFPPSANLPVCRVGISTPSFAALSSAKLSARPAAPGYNPLKKCAEKAALRRWRGSKLLRTLHFDKEFTLNVPWNQLLLLWLLIWFWRPGNLNALVPPKFV
jgi:hypothetical protein